jgi:rhodanese-related sulfurtransferase
MIANHCPMLSILYKLILPVAVLSLFAISLYGQVKSTAYRVMLKGLLNHSVPEVTVQEVSGNKNAYVFLDARESREYEVSHIEAAIPVGYDHFKLENLPADLGKDQPIIVYCAVGYRSEKVTGKLQKAGFTKVSNLYGGIFEWVNQSHLVVNHTGPTNDVHAFSRSWGVWLKKGNKVYK